MLLFTPRKAQLPKNILDFSLAPYLILGKVYTVEQLLQLHFAHHCQLYLICKSGWKSINILHKESMRQKVQR